MFAAFLAIRKSLFGQKLLILHNEAWNVDKLTFHTY